MGRDVFSIHSACLHRVYGVRAAFSIYHAKEFEISERNKLNRHRNDTCISICIILTGCNLVVVHIHLYIRTYVWSQADAEEFATKQENRLFDIDREYGLEKHGLGITDMVLI